MEDFPILFVDDDRQILEVVQAYLSRYGFVIETESSGIAALEKIEKHDYAVVFTDLIMPEISGLDLLKAVKKSGALTEVIIVTGYGTIESAIESLKLGGYDYVQKPINFERLKILIERIIEKTGLS